MRTTICKNALTTHFTLNVRQHKTPMKIGLYITLILTFFCQFSIAQIEIKRIWHDQVYNDIFIIKQSDTINLTKFKSWTEIVDYQLSLDSNYVFVRYKPNKPKTAYRLALYNTKDYKKIIEIIPGYGGTFSWNSNNQITHIWGCGTNCINLRVYNIHLEEILYTLSSGGFKLSPDKNIVVQFNMEGNKIWIFDLKTIDEKYSVNTCIININHEYQWQDFQFIDNYNILISGKAKTEIDLSDVKWKRMKTIETGEYYEK